MEEVRFDRFIKRVFIRKAPIDLYRCWTTGEGLTSWFLEKAEFYRDGKKLDPLVEAKANDTYSFKWYNWDPIEEGKVKEANGKDRFSFSFAGDCTVSVEFKAFEDGCILSLVQSNIPTDDLSKLKTHVGCSNGWTFWMANLKAYIEYGVLLHETEIDLSKNPSAPWEFINI